MEEEVTQDLGGSRRQPISCLSAEARAGPFSAASWGSLFGRSGSFICSEFFSHILILSSHSNYKEGTQSTSDVTNRHVLPLHEKKNEQVKTEAAKNM